MCSVESLYPHAPLDISISSLFVSSNEITSTQKLQRQSDSSIQLAVALTPLFWFMTFASGRHLSFDLGLRFCRRRRRCLTIRRKRCVSLFAVVCFCRRGGFCGFCVTFGLALLLHGLFTLVIWCVRRRGSFLLLNAFTSFLSRSFLSCALRLDNGKLFLLHVSVL